MKTLFVNEEGKLYKLNENFIITYSKRRAEKDRADRERLIEKARNLVEEPGKINAGIKRGGRKYLKKDSKEAEDILWILDEEKIQLDEQFDGYYGIQTGEKI